MQLIFSAILRLQNLPKPRFMAFLIYGLNIHLKVVKKKKKKKRKQDFFILHFVLKAVTWVILVTGINKGYVLIASNSTDLKVA